MSADADRVRGVLSLYNLYDRCIYRHGFLPESRDYEIVASLKEETPPAVHRFLFLGCVQVNFRMSLPPEGFSVDDVFMGGGREESGSPPGYVWGVRHTITYPGWEYVVDSSDAARWTTSLSTAMHEVSIHTNVYEIRLVFRDIRVEAGEAPESASKQ